MRLLSIAMLIAVALCTAPAAASQTSDSLPKRRSRSSRGTKPRHWIRRGVLRGDGTGRAQISTSGRCRQSAAKRSSQKKRSSLLDLTLDWTTQEAVVADSGELGFTLGRKGATFHDKAGKLITSYGKYMDVWRRQPDGTWRWIDGTWETTTRADALRLELRQQRSGQPKNRRR